MAILIIAVTIILYIILLGFTWHNLNAIISNKIKIIYILVGLAVVFIVTLIAFYISANSLEYQNSNMVGNIRNILLAVFIPVNGLIVMPYLASLVGKISSNDITQEKFKKRVIILSIIFIVILIFECSYFKSIQLGILDIINEM